MSATPYIVASTDVRRAPPRLDRAAAAGVATAATLLVMINGVAMGMEYGGAELPISTNTPRYEVYTNGDINLCVGGHAVMQNDILSSYRRISEIARLQKNWNGNGAPKFSKELLAALRDIVNELPAQPFIFPTARRSIQLEYKQERAYLEFELFEGGRIKKFTRTEAGKYFTVEDYSREEMKKDVLDFYQRDV